MKRIPSFCLLSMLVCSVGLLATACGDDGSLEPPALVAHVSLTLCIEPSTGSPTPSYTIIATATNDGDLPVHWWADGCVALTEVQGPDAHVVHVRRPVACPASFFPQSMDPGEVRSESYPFAGVIYDVNGQPVDAPPGTYAVAASIAWFVEGQEGWHRETLRQTFDWPPR